MTEVAELSPSVTKLCQALKSSKSLPIDKLSRECADPSTLSDAMNLGLIQLGRQTHSRSIADAKVRMVRKENKMVPALDDFGRQIMDHTYTIHTENEWSWMNSKNSENRLSVFEVLAEANDKANADLPPLHVKLTTAGGAAAAGKSPLLVAASA